MRRGALLLALVPAIAACGESSGPKPKTTIPAPTISPTIVKFSGPRSVACGPKGSIKTVAFQYVTRNASAVSPEVDGEAPGAQAGYGPQRGTMRFPYACPGPHTLTITAFDQKGQSVSKSAKVKAAEDRTAMTFTVSG